jgi:DNA modification methylase
MRYDDGFARLYQGDVLEVLSKLPDGVANMCVTSPPYWGLRDYGVEGQLGLEPTPEEYVCRMVDVFKEVRRVLRDDGTLWLNIGDSYASSPPGNTTKGVSGASTLHGINGASGAYRETLSQSVQTKRNTIVGDLKPKDLVGIPWMLAFALRADGWYLRSDIIWSKPNPMPESVTDRPTKAHEYLFLLSKRERYYYDADAIREAQGESSGWAKQRAKGVDTWQYNNTPERIAVTGQRTEASTFGTDGRNKRTVWTIATEPYPEAHFATFPTALVTPCVLAGCPEGGTVLEPFAGSGTTLAVAKQLGRKSIGIELNAEYCGLAERRLMAITQPMFAGEVA